MRARSLLVSSVVALTAVTVIPAQVRALVPTVGLSFEEPERLLDSRDLPGGLVIGLPIGPVAGERTIVRVTLATESERAWAYFHPCGSPVDRTEPAANFAEPGSQQMNLAPIDPGECVTLVGAAVLTVDRVARQSPSGDLSYVAADVPVDIPAAPGQTRFSVRDGLPADAEAVALWVTAASADNTAMVYELLNCVTGRSLGQVGSVTSDRLDSNLFVAPISSAGEVCFQDRLGQLTSVSIRRWGYLSPTATPTAEGLPYSGFVERELPGYEAVAPDRLFDTREAGGPIASGSTFRYRVSGLPTDATAVALNLTATETSGPGFVSAYPCDASEVPEVSNVNWTGAGATVPNFAIVSLGDTAELCFDVLSTTHLIADLAGYFVEGGGSGFATVAPNRLFDTRNLGGPVPGGTTYEFDLTGRLPAGATAAVVNVTITEPAGPGFATLYPCGQAPPDASNVNYLGGETRPNVAAVKIPGDGRICFLTSATAHILADLAGAFTPTSDIGLLSGTPFRQFDTRIDFGAVPFASGEELPLEFRSSYLRALAWNLTVTATEGPGFVVGYPCAGGLPDVSNVNYSAPGQTVANFAFLTIDSARQLCLFALTGTHLIADDAGGFFAPLPWEVYYDGEPPD